MNKKNSTSILGGSTLKEKLSIARKELNDLHSEDLDEKYSEKKENHNKNLISHNRAITKFYLEGRCDRKKHNYVNKGFYILEKLDNEIKKYCSGGDVAVFNYLMYLGLSEIKKRKEHSFALIKEMEDFFSKPHETI